MTDLAEFLLERLAEDEAVARLRDVQTFGAEQRAIAGVQGAFDPARVLGQCEANRQIVERCSGAFSPEPGEADVADFVLRALALLYADHPDYREEWRP